MVKDFLTNFYATHFLTLWSQGEVLFRMLWERGWFRDTTGILVTWTFYELTRHSEIYDQVLKEIDTVMKNELPTNETLKELSVLDRVIKEVLR